jgi:hypothetical protein
MNKLNRVISVGVVASAMFMASAIEGMAAMKVKQTDMLRAKEIKVCKLQMNGMGITMNDPSSKMTMG